MAKINIFFYKAAAVAGLIFFANVCAAASFSMPARGPYTVGQTFSIPLLVSAAPGESLNAVAATLTFPSDQLQVVSLNKTGIVSAWAEDPSYSNSEGTVSLQGLVYNPGFSGTNGTVITVTFRALSAGDAAVGIDSPSILANDGQGTDITSGARGTVISIARQASAPAPATPAPTAPAPAAPAIVAAPEAPAVVISSPTHPDQNAWYQGHEAAFFWENPPGTDAVKLGYGSTPTTSAQVYYEPAVSTKKLTLEDGTTYFAVQAHTAQGWGEVARYRVQIDSTPPKPFTLKITSSYTAGSSVEFADEDDPSGVDHYTVSLNGSTPVVVAADMAGRPYPLSAAARRGISAAAERTIYALDPAPLGTSTVEVVAYDRAGNAAAAQSEVFVDEVPAPGFFPFTRDQLVAAGWLILNWISVILVVVGCVGGVIFAIWYAWYRAHSYRRHLLRHLVKTDKELYGEFMGLYKALEEEVSGLQKEKAARELTSQEARILKRFVKLLQKTRKEIDDHHLHP